MRNGNLSEGNGNVAEGKPKEMGRDEQGLEPRAVVIGEALVDIVGGHAHVGGSPLNVASGLALLGVAACLHARVGDDDHGALITSHLHEAGVQLCPTFVDFGRTSTAVASIEDDGSASYEFDLDWRIDSPDVSQATLVHTGSIGAVLEPGGSVARAAIRAAGPRTLRSFDPNIRADIMGDAQRVRPLIRDLAADCHVVKLSDEDAAWLGAGTGETPEEVLRSLAESGVRLAVMTRGRNGCSAIADGVSIERRALPVALADTIGAGDAFMSGLLFGLVRDGTDRRLVDGTTLTSREVVRALDTALASAAIAVSRTGAQPPTLDELDRLLRRR